MGEIIISCLFTSRSICGSRHWQHFVNIIRLLEHDTAHWHYLILILKAISGLTFSSLADCWLLVASLTILLQSPYFEKVSTFLSSYTRGYVSLFCFSFIGCFPLMSSLEKRFNSASLMALGYVFGPTDRNSLLYAYRDLRTCLKCVLSQ